MQKRSSGVLLHISSLMGPYGIGCFGRDAMRFIDFLEKGGFRAWQVLPFSIPDGCNSPYKSVSAFAGNPLLIDPEQLFEEKLITKEELAGCRIGPSYAVDFTTLRPQRRALFHKAFRRRTPAIMERMAAFRAQHPWLEDFALYTALQEDTGKDWHDWEEPLRKRRPRALRAAAERLKDAVDEAVFLQYLFFTQWQKIHAYAREKGIEIIGDMPIYVSYESADVWSNQHLFALDEEGLPTEVAGVPPDFFSETGQRWGNPLYDWAAMELDGFSWWIARLGSAAALFDRVRIDHFRGFSAYWAVPAAAETAKEGQWLPGPGLKLFDALFREIDPGAVIAEDLGVRDPLLEELLRKTGLPGMRVLQFAFLGQDDGIHLPHNYLPNTVAYTGTHDNNTLLGFLWEITPKERAYCLDYCAFPGGDWKAGGAGNPAIRSILKTLWASPARLVMVPVQDLLGFGADTKMNHPGVAEGNWEFRLTEEAFTRLDPSVYQHLSDLYNR